MKLLKQGDIKFSDDMTYLPITMLQFEGLTNELLVELNKLTAPSALGGDYMAQILMEAIRTLDRTKAYVSKTDLFESCINLISRHVTFYAVESIKEKMQAANAKAGAPDATKQPQAEDDGSTSL